MTPEEALREVRKIRYRPKEVSLSWLAHQSGYAIQSLLRADRRGWMTQVMADALAPVFKALALSSGDNAQGRSLGPLASAPGPRGGARPRKRKRSRRARKVTTRARSIEETENVRPINDKDPATRS